MNLDDDMDDTTALPRTNRVRSGVCLALEEEANRLLAASLRGITSHAEKSDILTVWKERDRAAREVLSSSGSIDPAVRRGMCRREANNVQTHLNSRDCHTPATRFGKSSDPNEFLDGSAEHYGVA